MTAAEDRREELEALLWRERIPAPLVAKILVCADAYAKSSRPREPKPPAPKKPAGHRKGPAVHYALEGRGHPACRPFDLLSVTNWAVSGDMRDVTCGHCRRIFGRPKAGASLCPPMTPRPGPA